MGSYVAVDVYINLVSYDLWLYNLVAGGSLLQWEIATVASQRNIEISAHITNYQLTKNAIAIFKQTCSVA